MARRSAKRVIADKLTEGEHEKFSAKKVLTELLICGECGKHYRRMTWMHEPSVYATKGLKEIKWRCISRIQYGKKKCHNSPTIDKLIKLATIPETVESAMSNIAKYSDEMKALREFIETEKAKHAAARLDSDELNKVLERIE